MKTSKPSKKQVSTPRSRFNHSINFKMNGTLVSPCKWKENLLDNVSLNNIGIKDKSTQYPMATVRCKSSKNTTTTKPTAANGKIRI